MSRTPTKEDRLNGFRLDILNRVTRSMEAGDSGNTLLADQLATEAIDLFTQMDILGHDTNIDAARPFVLEAADFLERIHKRPIVTYWTFDLTRGTPAPDASAIQQAITDAHSFESIYGIAPQKVVDQLHTVATPIIFTDQIGKLLGSVDIKLTPQQISNYNESIEIRAPNNSYYKGIISYPDFRSLREIIKQAVTAISTVKDPVTISANGVDFFWDHNQKEVIGPPPKPPAPIPIPPVIPIPPDTNILTGQLNATPSTTAQTQKQIIDFEGFVKNNVLKKLPRTPEEAINFAIDITTAATIAFAAGEVIALAGEALYPTKHLGVTEAFSDGLRISGAAAVSAALYQIIITTSFGDQLRYYFNDLLTPKKPTGSLVIKGIHYSVADADELEQELKFEGHNTRSRELTQATKYNPLNVRMITKLIEQEAIDETFYTDQLLKDGLDPANVPKLINAFQKIELKPFKQNVIASIYSNYKDGYTSENDAILTLRVFGISEYLIKWVIKLANIDSSIAARKELDKIIEQEYRQNAITADKAIELKVKNGINRTRAAAQIKLINLKNWPSLKAAEKITFLAEFEKTFSL